MRRNSSDTKHPSGAKNHPEKSKAEKAVRSRKPKTTDRAQSDRFIEAARQLGIESVDDRFSKAVDAVIRAPKLPS
jgi:hypothetical protein